MSPCAYTQERIDELKRRGRGIGYLPKELSTQETRYKLGKISPAMGSNSVREGNLVTNDENPHDWFDYDITIDAPHLNTNEKQLFQEVEDEGRKLMSENQYIVAGWDSKLFTGKYLDQDSTWARVASRNEGRLVNVYFDSYGDLRADSGLEPDDRYPDIGGRCAVVSSFCHRV